MKKRLLSALLVLAMVLSLVPFGAFAADATEPAATLETQATEPAKATEPTQATEPAKATEPTKETEATDATETTEPTVQETTAPSVPTAVEKVQELIDDLPETVTAENRAEVENQLTAIDDAKLALSDAERDALDFGKYNAAIAALNELDDMAGAEVPEVLEDGTVTSEEELKTKINAGISPIVLGNDIPLNTYLNISGKTLTLDLNGHTLYTVNTLSHAVWLKNGAKLTVKDSVGNGKMKASYYCVMVYEKSTFTLESGTLSGYYGVFVRDGCTFHMNGGSVEGNSTCLDNMGTSKLNGGTLTGIVGNRGTIFFKETKINGTISTVGSYYRVDFEVADSRYASIAVSHSNGKVSELAAPTAQEGKGFVGWYNGDTKWDFTQIVTQNMTLTAKYDTITHDITYNKGEYQGTSMADAKGEIDKIQKEYGDNAFTLSQKVYTKDGYVQFGWEDDKGDFYLPGATYKANADLTLTAKWSDGTNVKSEEELRACIEAGISTIKLGADIALTSTLNISGKTLTLDLNGHVLSKQGSFYTRLVRVEKSSSLTIKDSGTGGKISDDVFGTESAITLESGTVEGALGASNGSTLTMNGGAANSINADATVYANGGKVNRSISLKMDGIVYANGTDIPFLSKGSGVDRYEIITCKVGDKVYCYTIKEKPVAPTAPEGETFQGWYKDNQEWDFSKGSYTEGTTVTAKFAPITYTITYNKGEMTDAKGDIDKVQKEYGDDKFTLSQKVYTKDGYLQVGWEDAQSNFYLPGAVYKENANLTLTAVWEKIITYKVPFTKTVKLAGSAKPGKVTFELHALPYGDYSQTPGKVDITGTVETNGKVDYNKGTLTISGSEKLLEQMLTDGIYVQEKNDGQKNWKYDSTIYWLTMPNDNILIYPVTVKTEDKETVYIPNEDKTVNTMTFTNTYGTSSNADTSNPKTGDEIYIAAATCLLSAMALIAIVPMRKREM